MSLSIDCIVILGCIVSVVRGDHDTLSGPHENHYSVSKLLTYGPKLTYGENCWLAPKGKEEAEFVLDLGCKKKVNTVELVNTPKDNPENRSMKEFKVYLSKSSDGPWTKVVHQTLEKNSEQSDTPPVKRFSFTKTKARFVRFKQKSFYGDGGGLQYFTVTLSGKTTEWRTFIGRDCRDRAIIGRELYRTEIFS